MDNFEKKKLILLAPVAGVIIFIGLYVLASILYPGGSEAYPHSKNFSFRDNYWCNLLRDQGINGHPNSGRQVAIAGMIILCFTLSIFWVVIPSYLHISGTLRRIIMISGVLAMASAFLLLTSLDHDIAVNLASSFGMIATILTLIGTYKNRWFGLFAFGILNLLLVVVNNYIYHTKVFFSYLAITQVITFAAFLIWICCINLKLYRISGIETAR